MRQFSPMRFFLCCFTLLLLSACVSKKKHLAALETIKTNHQVEVNQWQTQLNTSQAEVSDLSLQLAERKGENNILIDLRTELQDHIAELEAQIENMGSQSASQSQNLNANLKKKEKEIVALKLKLNEVGRTLDENAVIFQTLSAELTEAFQGYEEDSYSVITRYDQVTVSLSEPSLFRKNSTTRIEDSGLERLEKLSNVLARYPNFNVYVTGHTDNTAPKDSRRYTDNWNFSALQATSIVRMLIDEFDLSTSQLTAAAKGEYAPRGSNASAEGKAKNRRIEFIISPQVEDLAKAVRKVLEE